MTGPTFDPGFDPDRDQPRPVEIGVSTDVEVGAVIDGYRAENPKLSRSEIVHRILRHALRNEIAALAAAPNR